MQDVNNKIRTHAKSVLSTAGMFTHNSMISCLHAMHSIFFFLCSVHVYCAGTLLVLFSLSGHTAKCNKQGRWSHRDILRFRRVEDSGLCVPLHMCRNANERKPTNTFKWIPPGQGYVILSLRFCWTLHAVNLNDAKQINKAKIALLIWTSCSVCVCVFYRCF